MPFEMALLPWGMIDVSVLLRVCYFETLKKWPVFCFWSSVLFLLSLPGNCRLPGVILTNLSHCFGY